MVPKDSFPPCAKMREELLTIFESEKTKSFLNKCVRAYKGYIFRLDVNEKDIHINVIQEVIDVARDEWEECYGANELSKHDPCSDIENVIAVARDLRLPLESAFFDSFSNFRVNLNKTLVAQHIIYSALRNRPGRNKRCQKCSSTVATIVDIGLVELSQREMNNMTALQYRKFLVAKYIAIAMKKCGYSVDTKRFFRLPKIDVTSSTELVVYRQDKNVKDILSVNIGDVFLENWEESQDPLRIKTVIRLQSLQIKKMLKGEAKKSVRVKICGKAELELPNSTLIFSQMRLNAELLSKDPMTQAELDLSTDLKVNSDVTLLAIYNYTRLHSILARYIQPNSAEYRRLKSIEDVDFSVVTSTQEEVQMLQLIMEWPRLLESTIDFTREEINIPSTLKFMMEFSLRFTDFLSACFVLSKEKSSHNIDKTVARIWVLVAIQEVYRDFFQLLQIGTKFNEHHMKVFSANCAKVGK